MKKKRSPYVNPPELVGQQDLLGFPDLRTLGIPYCRQYVSKMVKENKFPKPIKFGNGPNCRCLFRKADIHEWIERKRAA